MSIAAYFRIILFFSSLPSRARSNAYSWTMGGKAGRILIRNSCSELRVVKKRASHRTPKHRHPELKIQALQEETQWLLRNKKARPSRDVGNKYAKRHSEAQRTSPRKLTLKLCRRISEPRFSSKTDLSSKCVARASTRLPVTSRWRVADFPNIQARLLLSSCRIQK